MPRAWHPNFCFVEYMSLSNAARETYQSSLTISTISLFSNRNYYLQGLSLLPLIPDFYSHSNKEI